MAAASINSASLWANQISALSAQCAARASALSASAANAAATSTASGGGGLFGDLVAALTQGSVTVNNPAAATTVSPAAGISNPAVPGGSRGRGQVAQDLQAFTQSLLQALASNQAAQSQGSGAGNTVTVGVGAAAGSSSGVSSAASGASLVNLNTTFNRLLRDLSASAGSSAAASTGNPFAGVAPNALAASSSAALPQLLQGMLQHLQQQGSTAALVGHAVHVVA